jgi:hypothetical protein
MTPYIEKCTSEYIISKRRLWKISIYNEKHIHTLSTYINDIVDKSDSTFSIYTDYEYWDFKTKY